MKPNFGSLNYGQFMIKHNTNHFLLSHRTTRRIVVHHELAILRVGPRAILLEE